MESSQLPYHQLLLFPLKDLTQHNLPFLRQRLRRVVIHDLKTPPFVLKLNPLVQLNPVKDQI